MDLFVRSGQLDLPRDFSLTIERTNPFLSEQGDITVPASLPSSSKNLGLVAHRDRIDGARKYSNKLDAVIQAGPILKHGTLVIDSVHRRNGIDASFAVDNGDLYAKAKDMTLKEIMDKGGEGKGYMEVFASISDALDAMNETFLGDEHDYVCFPVAVSAYENNGATVYQYNNELNSNPDEIRLTPTSVKEKDGSFVSVPDLYGVAPFLRLYSLTRILFNILGYTVTYNCLEHWPYAKMVLLHNCADALCTYDKYHGPILYYRDLVPSCTFGEFLEWLLKRLHVQPVVNSESNTVRIVSIEAILGREGYTPDYDLSRNVEGDWTVQLQPSRRIILTTRCELEGTEAAAETFDKLIRKYGSFYAVNEAEFAALEDNPTPNETGLVLRKATGQFYEELIRLNEMTYNPKLIGTNYFKYDRQNSDETEDFSANDLMPLMLCINDLFGMGGPCVVPYIGDRTHAHTTYNGSAADDKQDIILVQACYDITSYMMTSGTTQRYIPMSPNGEIDLGFDITTYGIYEACWARYNNLLLNSAPHLSGRLQIDIGKVLGMDMSTLKLCENQRLLPVKLSAKLMETSVNRGVSLADVEMILAKDYIDGISDTAFSPIDSSGLKWQTTDNSAAMAQEAWGSLGGGANFSPIPIPDSSQGVVSHDGYCAGYDIRYTGDPINPGVPTTLGQQLTFTRTADIIFHISEVIEYDSTHFDPVTQTYVPDTSTYNYEASVSKTITITFTAVSA